jgi:hypothetical protein
MRNGNAFTDTGAAKAFSVDQAAEDIFSGHAVQLLGDSLAGELKRSLFADHIDVAECTG